MTSQLAKLHNGAHAFVDQCDSYSTLFWQPKSFHILTASQQVVFVWEIDVTFHLEPPNFFDGDCKQYIAICCAAHLPRCLAIFRERQLSNLEILRAHQQIWSARDSRKHLSFVVE